MKAQSSFPVASKCQNRFLPSILSLCENSMYGERHSGKADASISKEASLYCSTSIPLKKKPQSNSQEPQTYIWLYVEMIRYSRQHGALALTHTDVGQLFSPVVGWQSESLKGCHCILQAVPYSHSLLVAEGGHTSHLLKPWQRKTFMRGGKLQKTTCGTPRDSTGCLTSWLCNNVQMITYDYALFFSGIIFTLLQ